MFLKGCEGFFKGILHIKMMKGCPWNPNLLQHKACDPRRPGAVLDFLWMKIMSHLEAKEVPEQRLTASTELRHRSLRMAADSGTLPATVLGLTSVIWLILSQPGLLSRTGILNTKIYIENKIMYSYIYNHIYLWYEYVYIYIYIYVYVNII